MRLRSVRRTLRSAWLLKLSIAAFILFSLLEVICLRWAHSLQEPVPSLKPQKIFIASTHWNNEPILRSHWNSAVLDLVKAIGADRVYVSVYESGSWDNSKDALRILDTELSALGVQRTIILDETTHADEIAKPPTQSGWIETPSGKMELRRIPYLSRLRNLSLKPLEQLRESGITFDKILFSNDVVFTVGAFTSHFFLFMGQVKMCFCLSR
jgi:Cryptococcal mannosyltransferase 1